MEIQLELESSYVDTRRRIVAGFDFKTRANSDETEVHGDATLAP
jgi:hypothetical protein